MCVCGSCVSVCRVWSLVCVRFCVLMCACAYDVCMCACVRVRSCVCSVYGSCVGMRVCGCVNTEM